MLDVQGFHIYNEIHEQPEIVRRVIERESEVVSSLCNHIRERRINHVLIAARGSSDNAGRYAKYLFGARNQLLVSLAAPSLFTIYQAPPRIENTLVLGISQSGQSPDITQVIREANRQGALTAAITNNPDSTLAGAAGCFLNMHSGKENSTAATKTYTSQLVMIALISSTLSNDQDSIDALQSLPEDIEATLNTTGAIIQTAKELQEVQCGAVIGRGFNYATAFELALKLKELSYITFEAYSSADFIHGPLALIETGFPAVLIAPSGKFNTEFQFFSKRVRALGARLVTISDRADLLRESDFPLQR